MSKYKAVHLVGFRGDEYLSALRVWKGPIFIHRWHDLRMYRDVGEEDIVIFANKEREDVIREYNADDLKEDK